MKNSILFCFAALLALVSCSTDDTLEQEQAPAGNGLTAAIADGLHENWSKGDGITLFHDGQKVSVETLASGGTSGLSGSVEGTFTDSNPLYGVYPAESAVSSDRESMTVSVSAAQTVGSDGRRIGSPHGLRIPDFPCHRRRHKVELPDVGRRRSNWKASMDMPWLVRLR